MSQNQPRYLAPGLPTREAAKEDISLIYSDHVPQLVSIGEIQLLTWNVYDGGPIFGYPTDNCLTHEEQDILNKYELFNTLRKIDDIQEIRERLLQEDEKLQDFIKEYKINYRILHKESLSLKKIIVNLFNEYKNKKDFTSQFETQRQLRIIKSIHTTLQNNPNISILTFQEMSAELRASLSSQLGNKWAFAFDGFNDTTTFYCKDVWEISNDQQLLKDVGDVPCGLQIFLQSKSSSQEIVLSNAHLNGSPDAFHTNVQTITNSLAPSATDGVLRVVIGDFNTPLREITQTSSITSLCPGQFNQYWGTRDDQPLDSTKEVVHALDGAFACQNHQLVPARVLAIDPSTGQEVDYHQDIKLPYIPNEQNYLENLVKDSIGILQYSVYVFKEKILESELFSYAHTRFEKEKNLKSHYFSFSFFFKGYSIEEKAKALYLLQLFKEHGENEEALRSFIETNKNDMPRLMGALQNGRLGKVISLKENCLSKLKNMVDSIINAPNPSPHQS